MRTQPQLFLDWDIRLGEPYRVPERAQRPVAYASKQDLEQEIFQCHHEQQVENKPPPVPPVLPKAPSQRRGILHLEAGERAGRLPHQPAFTPIWKAVTMGYFEKVYQSDLSHRARAVYMYLKDHAGKDGTYWPEIRTIAKELRLVPLHRQASPQ